MKKTKWFIIAFMFTIGISSCVKETDDKRTIQVAINDSTTFYFQLNKYKLNEAEVTRSPDSLGFYKGYLSIPETFFYKDKKYYVVGVDEHAFWDCKELYWVKIPNMVTYLENGAFSGCENLTSVEIPSSITHLPDDVFQGCGFSSFVIPNWITSIEGNAFSSCDKLVSVTIPESVSSIKRTAFIECSSLEAINVDERNAHYSSEDGVLFGGHKYELRIFPVAKSGAYTIPDGVASIGEWAFMRCEGLTSITIPSTVVSIGNNAFWECTNLTSLTCLADTPPVIEKGQLYGYFHEIKVPDSSIDAYKAADGWKMYADIIVGI